MLMYQTCAPLWTYLSDLMGRELITNGVRNKSPCLPPVQLIVLTKTKKNAGELCTRAILIKIVDYNILKRHL